MTGHSIPAPTGLSLQTPSPSNIATPEVEISGVVPGLTVILFTDNCQTEVARGLASAETIRLTTGVLAEGDYSFRALAANAQGRASACSTASVDFSLDLTPPAQVTNFTASGQMWPEPNTSPFLSWDPITGDPSFSHYMIELRDTDDTLIESYQNVGQSTSFQFTELNNENMGGYYALIKAVDIAGNESPPTRFEVGSYNFWVTNFGTKTFKSLAVGDGHTCGLTSQGTAYCWGWNTWGQLGNNSNITRQRPTAVDTSEITGNKSFLGLTAGRRHSCGLTSEGKVYCWGLNDDGQLGDSTIITRYKPTTIDKSNVTGEQAFQSLSAGERHTCGLTSQGVAYCWGSNAWNQLGDNTTTNRHRPTAIDTTNITGEKAFKGLTVGLAHSCGLTSEGMAYCWGINSDGRLGDNTTTNRARPTAVITTDITGEKAFVNLSAGGNYSCALTSEGKAYCWGSNSNGRLGDNTTTNRHRPTAVNSTNISGQKAFQTITTGRHHACGITSEGDTYCWGTNTYGQLGDNTTANHHLPTAVDTTNIAGEKAFKTLAAGAGYTCGLTSQGAAYCWGGNGFGQLGDNTTTNRSRPAAVDTAEVASENVFQSLAAGGSHSCGLTGEGVAYCWGSNGSGRLGDGTATSRDRPTAVDTTNISGEKAFKSLVAGDSHNCGLTSQGVAYCWGSNGSGRLGDNTTQQSFRPIAVDTTEVIGEKSFQHLTAGYQYTCGVTTEGVAYCWGNNGSGRIGDNTTTTRFRPTSVDTTGVTGEKTFRILTAGYIHTCGVTSEGDTYCWGGNASGQLGDNTITNRHRPALVDTTDISGERAWQNITAGPTHTCGLTSQGVAYCWGGNSDGQLGDNTTTTRHRPTLVDTTDILGEKTLQSLTSGGTDSFGSHTCGLTSEGVPYCWGSNGGWLGDNTTTDRHRPAPVDTTDILGEKTLQSLTTGSYHSCGLTSQGVAYCWGLNSSGRLGDGTTTSRPRPTAVDKSNL